MRSFRLYVESRDKTEAFMPEPPLSASSVNSPQAKHLGVQQLNMLHDRILDSSEISGDDVAIFVNKVLENLPEPFWNSEIRHWTLSVKRSVLGTTNWFMVQGALTHLAAYLKEGGEYKEAYEKALKYLKDSIAWLDKNPDFDNENSPDHEENMKQHAVVMSYLKATLPLIDSLVSSINKKPPSNRGYGYVINNKGY